MTETEDKDKPDPLKEFLQELFRARRDYIIECRLAEKAYERRIHKAGVKYWLTINGGEKEKDGTEGNT